MRQGLRPICGRCKTPLLASQKPLAVTDASFAHAIEHSAMPVLLDVWAPWCGPCRVLAPVIEELAGEMAGKILVAKLNVDENPATADRYNITSIPTLLLLRNGRDIDASSEQDQRGRSPGGLKMPPQERDRWRNARARGMHRCSLERNVSGLSGRIDAAGDVRNRFREDESCEITQKPGARRLAEDFDSRRLAAAEISPHNAVLQDQIFTA